MNNKKLLATGAVMVSLSVMATPHHAAAATADGDMQAVILAPITITPVDDLLFGTATVDAVIPGTIVVAPNGGGTAGGGVTLIGASTEQDATFTITGALGEAVVIDSTATSFLVADGPNDMVVDDFLFEMGAGAGAAGPINFNLTAGPDTLKVGATLNVDAAQAPGTYTGQFTIDVSYQ